MTASSDVAIDHVVPLSEAWESGAWSWSTDQREDFANDIDAPQLLSVGSSVNSSKGDDDPASWTPPSLGFHCDYARMWIDVKYDYQLTLQQAEKDALDAMLNTCP